MIYKFNDIIGNTSCVQLIKRSLDTGSFPQISIMCGTMGTGKSSTAKAVALALTCDTIRDHKFNACCSCISCKNAIASFSATGKSSYIKIFNAGQMTDIKEVKDMIDQIFLHDNGLHNNVYIIEEAHALSNIKNAQVILLDELDRMPSNSYLILTTTNINKIEKTIRSRAIAFTFHRLNAAESRVFIDKLSDEKHYHFSDKEIIDIIARNSQGIPRNIERALDFISGVNPSREELLDFFQQISDMELSDILICAMQDDALLFSQSVDKLCNNYEADTIVKAFKSYIARTYFEVMSGNHYSHILTDSGWDEVIKYVSTWNEDITSEDLRLKMINLRMRIRQVSPVDLYKREAITAQEERITASNIFKEIKDVKESEKAPDFNDLNLSKLQSISERKGFN